METKDVPGSDFLGEEQWKWLEQVLSDSKADMIVLGSGVQFLQNYRVIFTEGWHRHEKARFLDLIEKLRLNRVFIVSGDIHFYQHYQSACPIGGPAGYYLYESTSSGLSHVATTYIPLADHFAQVLSPRTYPISNL